MKKWAVLTLLSGAMFIIVIDTTIMNVSISALVEDLNTTVSGIQAAISIYALVMASFMLIGGKLADIIGKKRTFVIGLCIYGVGTTTASISQTLGMLIVGWSIMEGLGAALMMPNIQTILRDNYDDKDRAAAYGVIGAVGAIGAALGPIVGGALTTYASWRWAFRLELLIVIAVLVFINHIPKDQLADKRPKFDYLGAVLNVMGWSAIVLGFLMVQTYGFWLAKQPLVIGDLELAPFGLSVVPFIIGFGLIIIMLLLRWERHLEEKQGDGLFKPSLFRIEGLPSGFAVRFTQMSIFAGFLFTYPLLLQLSFEYSAIETGLALMPFSIALLIAAMVTARLTARFSAKRLIQAGFLIAIAGLLVFQFTIQPDFTAADVASAILFGVGLGMILPQTLNLVLSLASAKDTPETAGLNATSEQLGNAIGVALVGTMMLVSLSAGLEQGIEASDIIPAEDQAALTQGVEDGVELVSDSQLDEGLEAAGVDEATEAEVLEIYADARTDAFKAGVAFLLFVALVGLILTAGLPDIKLVGEEEPEAEEAIG
jgi:MFS family permease